MSESTAAIAVCSSNSGSETSSDAVSFFEISRNVEPIALSFQ